MSRSPLVTSLLLLALACFVVFGGEVVLPVCDRFDEGMHWRDYLADCQPDELRLKNFIGGYERQAGIVNLATGDVRGEAAPMDTEYGPMWSEVKSIFHTINFPGRSAPYTPAELAEIRRTLAGLSPPASGTLSYRQQTHVAFYQSGRLVIFDYAKEPPNADLEDLYRVLGFRLELR
jgi:hypothetical protein